MKNAKKIVKECFSIMLVAAMLILLLPVQAHAAQTTQTLRSTYGSTYGHVGTCINYSQLTNQSVLNHVKSQYNSITLENEMKPDSLLGGYANKISVSQAKSMGYYIPDNYKESTVPKINFDTVDKVMKICYENGIGMRAHTLVWHSQTPQWFFKNEYSASNGYVSQSVMDARMEFYIKTVMNHVYSSRYGSCVYAWDVVNEYLHATNSGWEAVYGKCGNRPAFVKRAYQYAYDCLDYYGLSGKVSLFYNDFNTYMEVNDVITMINYINSDKKLCNGVGMQSHVGTTFPSVDYYTQALKAFVNAGFEVQITELDTSSKSISDQANYVYQLMKNVNSVKKSGGNISGITLWGISDDVSWISASEYPLLFSSLNVPKDSYYKFIQAYNESGFVNSSGNNNQGGTGTGSQNYSTLSDGWYCIKNVNAQKYLQVQGNKAQSGQNVELGSGNGSSGQRWYLSNKGSGQITLKSELGYMLDVTGGKNADGTNIQICSENGATAQTFMLKSNGNNQYGIVTKTSEGAKGLDASNGGTYEGTNVQQYSYYGGINQLWVFEPIRSDNNGTIANGWYYIKNVNAQKYLQVKDNKGANGQNVEIGTGTGVKGQKWYVTNTNDGYVTLKNGQGYMLDVQNGANNDGTNIQTYQNNGADAQKFKITNLGNSQYGIVTKVSSDNKGIDVYNYGITDGTNVCQWSYTKGTNQRWIFEPCN
ncbi:MAG: endo-1,4-beta-xylanase [Roseburia sp.]|nr:endo-1,4-beta-xylanase [Roseburia sp.]